MLGRVPHQDALEKGRPLRGILRFEATTAFLPTLAVRSRCLQRQLHVDTDRPLRAISGRSLALWRTRPIGPFASVPGTGGINAGCDIYIAV